MSETGSRSNSRYPSRSASRQGYNPLPQTTGFSSGPHVPVSQRYDYVVDTPPGAFPPTPVRTTVPTIQPPPARAPTATADEPAFVSSDESESDDSTSTHKSELYKAIERTEQEKQALAKTVQRLTEELEDAKAVQASLTLESPHSEPKPEPSSSKGKGKTPPDPSPPSPSPSDADENLNPPPPPPHNPNPPSDPDPDPPGDPTYTIFDSDNENDDTMEKLISSSFERIDKLKADGSNWTIWSGQVKDILTMVGCESLTAGELPATATDDEKKHDRLILGFMKISLNDVTWQHQQKVGGVRMPYKHFRGA